MNDKLKEALLALRTLLAFVAEVTPMEHDNLLLEWLDWIIGTGPLPAEPHPAMLTASVMEGEGVTTYAAIDWSKLPWDKLLPLILPIIERRLPEIIGAVISQITKWLESK